MARLFQRSFCFLGLLLTAAFGCASSSQEADPDLFYKRDITIIYGGKEYRGAVTLPRSDVYKIRLESPGRLDLLSISTCHREYLKEAVGYNHDWTYQPVPGLETGAACPLNIAGYDSTVGKHAFGFVNFEAEELKAKARISCNGASWTANGVGVCQARDGLIQVVAFDHETRVVSNESCRLGVVKSKVFQFQIKQGNCQYLFENETGRFLLDTIGYQEVLIRKN